MKKILIIEDESMLRENLRQLLVRFNYEVSEACDGLQGIKLAETLLPDLIISDVMMPDLDGFEVLENLSRQPETSAIPFIFLTARAEMSDLRHGMDLGADDYLVKPFKAGDLIRAIETRLNKKKRILESEGYPLKENNPAHQLNHNSVIVIGNPPEVIKISDIVYIKADDVYTDVFLISGKKMLVRKLLKEWEAILYEQQFLRIHNSTIINLDYLEKVQKWFNNSLRVYLKNIKEPLEVSKRYSPRVKSYLKF